MKGYLGESKVDISTTKYKDNTPNDWAMLYIEMYSGIDGSHHKDWIIDQIARILKGTEVVLKIAKWENGQEEERFYLADPMPNYWKWVAEMKDGENGPETYSYDFGIAP